MPADRVGQAPEVAAKSARSSRVFKGAKHRSRLARLESAKAIKAASPELARIVRAMLEANKAHVEKGVAAFEEQRRKRKIAGHKRMAASLDLELVLPTTDASAESAARP